MTKLRNFIRRYTSIPSVIDALRRQELTLLDPQSWDDRNDRHFMALYKERRNLGGLYALCAATCSETYHHWRVFAGAADGACIELRREPLEAALRKFEGVSFGEVEYLLLNKVEALTPDDLARLPFVKRQGFAAEEEYRIIAETREAQLPAISTHLPVAWINRIYLNPWLPSPLADSVTRTLREIRGCSRLSIQKSHLIENDRWKKAGDRVAEKKQPSARIHLTSSEDIS